MMAAVRGVAITGMGLVSSVGHDVASFTEALRRGVSGVRARAVVTPPGGSAVKVAAEIRDFDFETALSVHASLEDVCRRARRIGARASLGVRTSLVALLEAWSSAGLARRPVARQRVAVVVAGSNLSQGEAFRTHVRHAEDVSFVNPRFALGFLDTHYVGVLSEAIGACGEGFTVGAASASGNVALVRAHDLLSLGRCDVCVVLGPAADLSSVELQALYNSGALAKTHGDQPDKASRPFDRDHDGFVYGQSSACMVLESHASASGRDALVLADFLGGAVHLDGNASSNPSVAGEVLTMRGALHRAARGPRDIGYVNAHGSSSPLGDETELAALRETFGAHTESVLVNSTKGLIGHCLWSAGLVEAIATIAQIRGGFVHRNANLEHPIDGVFSLAGETARTATIECALSNSFGFSGINSCVVLARSEARK